jgi:putative NADH-flavin reductase
MAGDRILVLGATGPSGICLLRELLYRHHAAIAYVRNPSKIPSDLYDNPLLEVTTLLSTDHKALLIQYPNLGHQRRNRRLGDPFLCYS